MRRARITASVAVAIGAFVFTPAAPAAATPPCIAQLASTVGGEMSGTVAAWQDDFLNLGQPAGWYAVHIARSNTNCPPI